MEGPRNEGRDLAWRCLRAVLAASALACAACAPEAPPPPDGPNVLLVTLDSVRRDTLGCYGYRPPLAPERSPSPNLDALAERGVLFGAARATTSWTLPSHVSLLTGTYELEHGVEDDGQALAPDVPLLAERLAAAGYRTAGFYSGPYLDPRHGFGRGFERYEEAYGPELSSAVATARAVEEELARANESRDPVEIQAALGRRGEALRAVEVASHRDRSSEQVRDRALAELEAAAADERPFFLFLHFFDPHYDYAPPPPWDTAFDPDYAGTLDGRDYFRDPRIAAFDPASPSGRRRALDDRDLEHVRALYAGELAWTDAALGAVLDRLAALGLDEDTLVIVTADHGEEFFEHGGIGHRRTLFEEVLAVPLLVRLPGGRGAGTRSDRPVSLAQVAPTVLREVGLERAGAADLFDPPPGFPARLVTRQPMTLTVELARTSVAVPVELVTVQEAWHEAALEIRRERRFLRPSSPIRSAELGAAIARRSAELWAEEDLRWVDLRGPLRGEGEPRTDFDGDARSALERFRESCAALAARRAEARAVPSDPALSGALRGLGYVGELAEEPDRGPSPVLPPPVAPEPDRGG